MADVRRTRRLLREPADCDQPAAARCTLEELEGDIHLDTRRPPIGIRTKGLVRMCRNDVPEQQVVLDAELREDPVDDRRARLGRPRPVSCRSDVNGIPETRAPRYPAASPTSTTVARRFDAR